MDKKNGEKMLIDERELDIHKLQHPFYVVRFLFTFFGFFFVPHHQRKNSFYAGECGLDENGEELSLEHVDGILLHT